MDFSCSFQVYQNLLCMHGILQGLYTVVLLKYAKSHWHNSQGRVWFNVSVIHVLKLSKYDLTWQSVMPLHFNFPLCLWHKLHKLRYMTVSWSSIYDPYFCYIYYTYIYAYLYIYTFVCLQLLNIYPRWELRDNSFLQSLVPPAVPMRWS